MSDWQQLLRQTKLTQALDTLIQLIKSNPKDAALRSSFIELLCIDGQLERADEQLVQAIKLFPEFVSGASQIRHLLKGAQARLDFAKGRVTAQFLGGQDAQYEKLTQLNLAIYHNQEADIAHLSQELETLRTPSPLTINGQAYQDVRDIDDTLGGFIELFSHSGNYYLAPMERLVYLNIRPASSLLESIWRPVEFEIEGGTEGEAHMPLTYLQADSSAHKLAKETDWLSVSYQDVFQGQGQKVWLADESAVAITSVTQVSSPVNCAL